MNAVRKHRQDIYPAFLFFLVLTTWATMGTSNSSADRAPQSEWGQESLTPLAANACEEIVTKENVSTLQPNLKEEKWNLFTMPDSRQAMRCEQNVN